MSKISAVLVLYHPDLELLRQNLNAITPQLDRIYIIDNSPETDIGNWDGFESTHTYIPLRCNTGIAAAQNVGIEKALQDGTEMIYFLDQDSVSPENIIEKLVLNFERLNERGIKVGAIGALPINCITGKSYIPPTSSAAGIEGMTEVREMISSGSLIPTSALKKAGTMMEELFIDGVDHEWCWRAKARGGYRFFIVNDCHLSHLLGQGDRRMMWWKVAIPSPFRTYYLYRNIFILSRLSHVPLSFKIKNSIKLLFKIGYYPIFISPRKEYSKNIFKGIRDGIKYLIKRKGG
ncbi:MAG: glycosyltransferase family 2 protein [Muribaculaceae bacterium]|nr:glycosyltransferase family 2 protein [Muribaculaceae bacterium]